LNVEHLTHSFTIDNNNWLWLRHKCNFKLKWKKSAQKIIINAN
jgi:hypothetical protein